MPTDPLHEVEEVAEELLTTLREDLLGRDGYLVVLVLTLVTVVIIPISEAFRGGAILVASVLGLLVLVTLTRSQVSPWLQKAGLAVIVLSFVLAVAVTVVGHAPNVATETTTQRSIIAAVSASYCVVLALCFPAILRRAFSHRTVTLNTVAAALSAYLLLGIIFASAFRFVNIVDGPFFNQSGTNGFTYEYFSYVTLTTVGYGDYTAASDAGRTLAMLEALLGQVFLVTIVAMVVANLGQSHARLRGGPSAPAAGRDPRVDDHPRPTPAAPNDPPDPGPDPDPDSAPDPGS